MKGKFNSEYHYLCWLAFKATGNPYAIQECLAERYKKENERDR